MKFSIVTPSYNMEKWIKHTINSVVSQKGEFEIEYILVDDNSTDKTKSIFLDYKNKIENGEYSINCSGVEMICITPEQKLGMYNAINKGFEIATGDILAWINADDTYAYDAFNKIYKVMKEFPNIDWIKGITNSIDENGNLIKEGRCRLYDRKWIKKGIYGHHSYFIEQDSVFWKKELWQKIDSIPKNFMSAGDYWLWTEFANYTKLTSLNCHISNFRKRRDQLSKDIMTYKTEQKNIRGDSPKISVARIFFSLQGRIGGRNIFFDILFNFLYVIFFPFTLPFSYIHVSDSGDIINKKTFKFIV